MRAFTACLVVAALVASVSCESPYQSKAVDLLDVDALVNGVYSKKNADWFRKNAGPHGLDCDDKCRGFGEKTGKDCKGLHKTTCEGVFVGDKVTVHTKMIYTCLGSYTFQQNVTDDYLTMGTGCHGLFGGHTFTGITKNVTVLPENCGGHCSHDSDDRDHGHCGEHCPDRPHHSNFDAIVKTEMTCGLTHAWSLDHPLAEGATVSQESTCSGMSSFSMWVYGKLDIPADEDMEGIFEQEAASYDSADSDTIIGKLSSLSQDTKSLNFLDISPSVEFSHHNETMDVTCNGKPANLTEDCDGKLKVVREGDSFGAQFEEVSVCEGEYMFFHGAFVCQGKTTTERTDTCDHGKKETKDVCDGKQILSVFGKDPMGHKAVGFGVICAGEEDYVVAETHTHEEAEPKKAEPEAEPKKAEPEAEPEKAEPAAEEPQAEPEAKPVEPTEYAPESETPVAEVVPSPASKSTLKRIHVSLYKNIRKTII